MIVQRRRVQGGLEDQKKNTTAIRAPNQPLNDLLFVGCGWQQTVSIFVHSAGSDWKFQSNCFHDCDEEGLCVAVAGTAFEAEGLTRLLSKKAPVGAQL